MAFNLKSGNTTSFKMMGSSPVKVGKIGKVKKLVQKSVGFVKSFFNKPKNNPNLTKTVEQTDNWDYNRVKKSLMDQFENQPGYKNK
tara:strand:+ start:2988 stop:3245 length:258 start_codon:yes stop_codon:yes gene_type:complete